MEYNGTIWWQELCGNHTIHDAFWNDIFWTSDSPVLSRCFQETILTWIPCLFFWTLYPFYMSSLADMPTCHGTLDGTRLNKFKVILGIVMTGNALSELVINIASGDSHVSTYIADTLVAIKMAGVTVVMRWEFVKGIHSSVMVSVFWLLVTVCRTMQLWSSTVAYQNAMWWSSELKYAMGVVLTCLTYVQFGLTFLADTGARLPADIPLEGAALGYVPLHEESDTDSKKTRFKPNPLQRVSAWSQIYSLWMWPSIWRSRKADMELSDLPDIPLDLTSDRSFDTFMSYLQNNSSSTRITLNINPRSAYIALAKIICPPLLMALLLDLFGSMFRILPAVMVGIFVRYVSSSDPATWKGVFIAIAMLGALLAASLCRYNNAFVCQKVGIRVRALLATAIYRKVMILSSSAKKNLTVGELLGYLSVDVDRTEAAFRAWGYSAALPFEIILVSSLLFHMHGVTALGGVLLLNVVFPLAALYTMHYSFRLASKQMKLKGKRFLMFNEVLTGIKGIKLFAWEKTFVRKISERRGREMGTILQQGMVMSAIIAFRVTVITLAALLIFGVYVLTSADRILSTDQVFTTISYMAIMEQKLSPLPVFLHLVSQGLKSIHRIVAFLQLDELPADHMARRSSITDAIRCEGGNFKWEENGPTILKEITIRVPPGQLVAVVGYVGAGKSSLLSAILGEMFNEREYFKINGDMALVTQQAWLRNRDVRENILFGKTYQRDKYVTVIRACSLNPDLAALPDGDKTEIGAKGINLSGGQKQRICMARAVYHDSDIYLLDDPLAALDAHVGKAIFKRVIGNDGLLKNKTRILVTHAIHLLPYVDTVMVIDSGRVVEVGHFDALMERGGRFADYINSYMKGTDGAAFSSTDDERLSSSLSDAEGQSKRRMEGGGTSSGTRKFPEKLVPEEEIEKGHISMEVLAYYLNTLGRYKGPIVLFTLLQTAFYAGSFLWLSKWTEDRPVEGMSFVDQSNYRLGIYTLFVALFMLTTIACLVCLTYSTTRASKEMHLNALTNVLRCPMAFFDRTPIGRIMNRFTKDLDGVDSQLPFVLRSVVGVSAALLGSIVVTSYSTPAFLLPFLAIIVLAVKVQRFYTKFTIQIRRMESLTRSPAYSHFEESVTGAAILRAHDCVESFTRTACNLIDCSNVPTYAQYSCNKWLSLTLEALGSLTVFSAVVTATFSRDLIGPGLAAAAVTSSLLTLAIASGTVRLAVEMELGMVFVERVMQYTNLPEEAAWEVPGDADYLEDWPLEGSVRLCDYSTRYRPGMPLVLKDVNVDIRPGEMVGVVGRTGAGKSSMAMSLFRMIESSGGRILIDGVDIAKIGLHKLRANIGIIPQDPVLFSGSLRLNVDPSDWYSDERIWLALEQAHLKAFVVSRGQGLNMDCGEAGNMLSLGQQQLVCLARALLRRSKVLVLDEATAALDMETDAFLQRSLREHFSRSTVIVIAHRLHTVIDCSKILLLEKGRVKEYDSPVNLLSNRKSSFYKMAKRAGVV